ncbi:hypothetical protein F5146DRAFT_1225237 [Armillaria mellea]|nr:hypothetical protein F5146DRAFT_1225237 [Armillaria mellea]
MNLLWAFGAAAVTCGAILYLEHVFRRKQLSRETCILDIDSLGFRVSHEKIKGTAVICGGSIGGLIAARVCHDHFDDVLIVEPEAWLNSPDAMRVDPWNQECKRSRIVQYNSLHLLLAIGYKALSKLFPNIEEQSKASGIRIGPNETAFHFWSHSARMPYAEYGGTLPKTIYASRAGTETFIRRLVLGGEYKNIRQIIGTVTGVSRSPHNPSSLTMLQSVLLKGPETLQLLSSLIVQDLQLLLPGLPYPYDDCGPIYCNSPDLSKDDRCTYSQRVDGDILQVCFTAMGECELPKTLKEAKAGALSLVTEKPIPETFFKMLDMLDEVKDTMTCSQVRYPGSSHIRYEKAVNLPSNWVALGDSVMRVNPIYGQGCSKAILGAIYLDQLLRNATEIPKGFSKKYFSIHVEKIRPIWEGLKVSDYSFPETIPLPGETLSNGSWLRWYMKKLIVLAFTDDQAGSAVWRSKCLLAPSSETFQLGLILKVCWSVIKG